MTKTATTEEPRICTVCGGPLTYSRKLRKWICEQCLYGAFLTDQAQREAVKRYRQSEKGKEAEKKYEQSEKGKTARERYLKSEKYKAARRQYNLRLKESLAIARQAELARPKRFAEVEEVLLEERAALIQDIKEYIDGRGVPPTVANVRSQAGDYGIELTDDEALELIKRAQHH